MTGRSLESLTSWHSDWSGLRVAVLGLGVTGFSVADTLAELGCTVLVASASAQEAMTDILEVLGVDVVLDDFEHGVPARLNKFEPELVVVSPGFSPRHPAIAWANSTGAAVWGDIELAWRLRDKTGTAAEWITVTGTNGKTTVVQLTARMLAEGGFRAAECGNNGVPVLDAIRDPAGFDVLVVELSSFQLHWLNSVSAFSSACLNVADDHLDWHGSAEAYRVAKGKVYENTTVACVYNRDDSATRILVEDADVAEGCRAIGFGFGVPGPSDFGIVDGIVCDRAFLDQRADSALEITTVAELADAGLASPHLVANSLAASALARSFGTPVDAVRRALLGFHPDRHRSEIVTRHRGVVWIDDSKATNPHAAHASVSAFDSVVWIVGGDFKGTSPDGLIASVAGRLRGAVVLGSDRAQLVDSFARHAPELTVIEVTTTETEDVMPHAVRLAAELAGDGDVVLLAPAAASMDQFANYADRGTRFADAVANMVRGDADDLERPAPPPKA